MENIFPFCQDGTFYPGSTCSGEAHVENSLQLYEVLISSRPGGGTIFRGRISPLFNRDPSKARHFLSIHA